MKTIEIKPMSIAVIASGGAGGGVISSEIALICEVDGKLVCNELLIQSGYGAVGVIALIKYAIASNTPLRLAGYDNKEEGEFHIESIEAKGLEIKCGVICRELKEG